MDSPKTPGQYLTETRRMRKLTQARLSAALGVPMQSISSWERNTEPLPRRYIQALHEILGINRTTMINLMVAAYRQDLVDAINHAAKTTNRRNK